MTTLAHAQGGPRPADLAFHPGLQIHAIQAPRADRRLSLLISLLCYESLAAGVFLTLQHKETILARIRTSQTVILDPVQARLEPAQVKPVLPTPPAPGPVLPAVADPVIAAPLPDTAPDQVVAKLPPDRSASLLHPGGGGPGVVGADPNGRPGPAAHGHGTGDPLEITVSQVQVLHSVTPVYPTLARLTRKQGDVVLRMTIDATGAVSEVHVVSGPEIFREEAIRAARGWRFTPARVAGETVPAAFNLTLQFVMR
ncbi:MAG: TonB family protein [Holophagaceae bacterium]